MVRFIGAFILEALILSALYLLGSFVAYDFNPASWEPILRFVIGGSSLYATVQVLSAVLDGD